MADVSPDVWDGAFRSALKLEHVNVKGDLIVQLLTTTTVEQ